MASEFHALHNTLCLDPKVQELDQNDLRTFISRLSQNRVFTFCSTPREKWKGSQTSAIDVSCHKGIIIEPASRDDKGRFIPALIKLDGAPPVLLMTFPPPKEQYAILMAELEKSSHEANQHTLHPLGQPLLTDAQEGSSIPSPASKKQTPKEVAKTVDVAWDPRETGERKIVVWISSAVIDSPLQNEQAANQKIYLSKRNTISEVRETVARMGFQFVEKCKCADAYTFIEANFPKILCVVTSSMSKDTDTGEASENIFPGVELLKKISILRDENMGDVELNNSTALASTMVMSKTRDCMEKFPLLMLQTSHVGLHEGLIADVYIRLKEAEDRPKLVIRELAKRFVKPVVLWVKKEGPGRTNLRFAAHQAGIEGVEDERAQKAMSRISKAGFSLVHCTDTMTGFKWIQENITRLKVLVVGSFDRSELLGHFNGLELAYRVRKMCRGSREIRKVLFCQDRKEWTKEEIEKVGFDLKTGQYKEDELKATEAVISHIEKEGLAIAAQGSTNLEGCCYFAKNVPIQLANTFRCAFEIQHRGKTMKIPTVEHYFQAAKHLHQRPQLAEEIVKAPVHFALQLALTRKIDDKWWRNAREQVMRYGLWKKFSEDESLKNALLETGYRDLILHHEDDEFWGDAPGGAGSNKFGQFLGETRNMLRRGESGPSDPLINVEPTGQANDIGAVLPSRNEMFSIDKSQVLGAGGMATVYRAYDNLIGYDVAAKVAKLDGLGVEALSAIISEANLLSEFDNEYIVKLYYADIQPTEAKFYMQWMSGGSIEQRVKEFRFYEATIHNHAKSILRGLHYLHDTAKAIHGDIKCANILLNENGAHLSDFGLSAFNKAYQAGSERDGNFSKFGSYRYMSRERYATNAISPEDDIWAVGISILRMAMGGAEMPWGVDNVLQVAQKLLNCKSCDDLFIPDKNCLYMPQQLSPLAQDFIRKCLIFDPEERPSAQALLQHEWILTVAHEIPQIEDVVKYNAAYTVAHLPKPKPTIPAGNAVNAAVGLRQGVPDPLLMLQDVEDGDLMGERQESGGDFTRQLAVTAAESDSSSSTGTQGVRFPPVSAKMLLQIEPDFHNLLRRHLGHISLPSTVSILNHWQDYSPKQAAAMITAQLLHAAKAKQEQGTTDRDHAAGNPAIAALADILRFVIRRISISVTDFSRNSNQYTASVPLPRATEVKSSDSLPSRPVTVTEGASKTIDQFLSGVLAALENVEEGEDTEQSGADCDEVLADRYLLQKELGRGSQGVVYLAIDFDCNNEKRAIKRVSLKPKLGSTPEVDLRREIKTLRNCQHEYIVRLYHVVTMPAVKQVYLVMQHVDGGSLGEVDTEGILYHDPIPPVRLAHYMRQLSAALLHLKHQKIMHGDVKPANFLLDTKKDVAFLTDFGVAHWLKDDAKDDTGSASLAAVTDYGTPEFGPPDTGNNEHWPSLVLSGLSDHVKKAAFAADVYAFGLSFYVLLYHQMPLPPRTPGFMRMKEIGNFPFPETVLSGDGAQIPIPCYPMWVNLFKAALNPVLADRITLEDLRPMIIELCDALDRSCDSGDELVVSQATHAPRIVYRNALLEGQTGVDFKNGSVFEEICHVNSGSYGMIKHVRDRRDNQEYAVKVVSKAKLEELSRQKKDSSALHTYQVEHKVLTECAHPCLIKHYGCYETDDKVFYVLEYVPGGNLTARIRSSPLISFETVRIYTAELLLGLCHLHKKGVLYRDLKTDNVLILSDGHCVLCDFGFAKFQNSPEEADRPADHTCLGTGPYMSPEVVLGASYDARVDMWSLGVLVCFMVYGTYPFEIGSTLNSLLLAVKETEPQLPTTPQATGGDEESIALAKDFILKLLTKDPQNRPTSSEARKHPFVAPFINSPGLRSLKICDWIPPTQKNSSE